MYTRTLEIFGLWTIDVAAGLDLELLFIVFLFYLFVCFHRVLTAIEALYTQNIVVVVNDIITKR